MWCERARTAAPFCGQSEVEPTDCLQYVSLLSAVSTAPQQQDLVLAVDDALGLVWTLIAIEVAEAFGCSELAYQTVVSNFSNMIENWQNRVWTEKPRKGRIIILSLVLNSRE